MRPAFATERYGHGLLWLLGGPGGQGHVFGTFQAPEGRLGALPAEVRRAFDGAGRLVVENAPEAYSDDRFRRAATFEADRSLSQVLGAQDFERAVLSLQPLGLPREALDRLKPWALLLNLGVTGGAQASPPDARLAALAEARGVPIEALEGLEEQIFIFDEFPMEAQVALLRHGLAHPDELAEVAERTLQAYHRGDLAGISRATEDQRVRNPAVAAHFEALTKRVLHDRSVVMAHRMQRSLRRGDAFIALGALHLYGQKGVLALLEQRGFDVARVL
jgi:uncharacterized protein